MGKLQSFNATVWWLVCWGFCLYIVSGEFATTMTNPARMPIHQHNSGFPMKTMQRSRPLGKASYISSGGGGYVGGGSDPGYKDGGDGYGSSPGGSGGGGGGGFGGGGGGGGGCFSCGGGGGGSGGFGGGNEPGMGGAPGGGHGSGGGFGPGYGSPRPGKGYGPDFRKDMLSKMANETRQ